MKVIQFYKNELKLIKRAQKNNREAQHALYKMHAPKMLSICRYYIKDLQHAEEAMLNGFLKVFTNINKFKNEGSFEGWIRRIITREAISFLRQKKQIEFVTDAIEVAHDYTNNIESEIEVEDIQKMIDALPDGYKIVFNMFAIEGYKHQEIATLLNISVGASKSQLFKARKMLQAQINKRNTSNYGTN